MTIKRTIALMLSLLILLSLLPTALAAGSHTHSWKEVSRVNPACTKDGYAVYVCSCGARKNEPLPALGHKFSEKVYVSYADCEHYGVFYWVCERCGAHSDNGNDKPLGHDWDGGVITKQPTETEEGEITYTCKRDPSHTKTEVIPATGEDNGPHPALTLSASAGKVTLHKYEWSNDGGGYDIDLHTMETVTNAGDIPLQLSRHVWYNKDVSEESDYYGYNDSLESDGTRTEAELTLLYSYYAQIDDPYNGSIINHLISTPGDPQYRGYCDVSICYYGYDIDDTDREGEILCKSNVVTLRAYVPNEFDEAKPELTLEWKFDTIFHNDGCYITTDPGILAVDDGAVAHCDLTNTGNVPLEVHDHMTNAAGSGSGSSGILEPGKTIAIYWGDKPIAPEITPGTGTDELLGTVTYTIWVVGFDPDTGEELCKSDEVVRTWKIGKSADTDMPEGFSDYCALTLETLSDTEAKYTLHTCSAHLETAEAAEELSLAGDWAGAAELWSAEINILYEEMAEILGGDTAEVLEEDREAFFEYADAVAALFGDEKAAEMLRLRCAELCCIMHTAPIRLPSSLLGEYGIQETAGSFDVSGRFIGALNGSDSEVVEQYSGPAAKAMADTRILLDKDADGQTDSAFGQCADYWKTALDETVSSAYKAADKNVRALISAWSMPRSYLCETDEALYSLLYATSAAVAEEHMLDLYREAALLIGSLE